MFSLHINLYYCSQALHLESHSGLKLESKYSYWALRNANKLIIINIIVIMTNRHRNFDQLTLPY